MEEDEGHRPGARPGAPWLFRGGDLSRALALSDGIFAFSMTLLVLELVLPAGTQGSAVGSYLLRPQFASALYAYLISFFVISMWWQAHHLVFSYIERYDRPLLRRNVFFLFFIAVMPFATQVLNAAGSVWIGPVVFSVIQVGAGGSLGALWLYATGTGGLIPPRLPEEWRRYVRTTLLTTPAFFAATIPVAFVDPTAAEVLWLVILVLLAVARTRSHQDRG